MIIYIIGPNSVGKTTSGALLAEKIGYRFIDLDETFMNEVGNINTMVKEQGYEVYARANCKLFRQLLEKNLENTVIALSGGFLVYPFDDLGLKNQQLLKKTGTSIRLLPSESKERSAEIVVPREEKRYAHENRPKQQAREKLMKRYDDYLVMGDIKIFSEGPAQKTAELMFQNIREKYNLVFHFC